MRDFQKILFISLIFFSGEIISEKNSTDLFFAESNEIDLFPACTKLKDPLAIQPIRQYPPRYPRRALEQGVQGTVLVKLNISDEGKVISSEVIWSSSDNPKYENIFDKNSIEASKRFIYQPKINEHGDKIASKSYAVIVFTIEGLEETLNLGSQTRKFNSLRRMMRDNPEKFLIEVEKLLSGKDLSKIQRAIYLYFKGLVVYKRGAKVEKVISILEGSQKNYLQTYTYETGNFEDKNIVLMGNNESKLHTFNGILLGQLYMEQSRWNEAAVQSASVIRIARNQKIDSPRFLQAYINFGISAYNLKNWCQASESWKSANELSKKIQRTLPEWISPFIAEANKRRALETVE